MKRSNLFLPYLLTCLFAGTFTAGCEFDFSAPPVPANRCAIDSDCTQGVCDDVAGFCISPTSSSLDIVLAITPASDELGGLPLTTVQTFRLAGPAERPISLDAPVLVQGTVRNADGRTPVNAELRFEPDTLEYDESLLNGSSSASTQGGQVSGEFMGDYAVRLVGERTYRVRVTPVGDDAFTHAPLERSITTPQADPEGLGVSSFDLTFPPVDSYREFWGRVVVSDERGEFSGIRNLTVRAVHPSTGQTVSSMAITNSQEGALGEFKILLPEDVEDYHLRVTHEDHGSFQHTIVIDPSYLHYEGEGPVMLLIQQPTLVDFEGLVETSEAMPEPVHQANVAFYARSLTRDGDIVLGSSRVNTTTDESGVFHVQLLEGEYAIVITPRSGDELSIGLAQQTIMASEGGRRLLGQAFPLKPQTSVVGHVTMPNMSALPGATIEARAHNIAGLVDRLSGVGHHRTNSTTSDGVGSFVLPLDDGSYDLIAHPSAESQLPWLVATGLLVGESHPVVAQSDYQFDAPVPITGRITLGLMPQAGAEVRAFALIPGEDGAERTVQIGRAVSDETGNYRLLLPPRLQNF